VQQVVLAAAALAAAVAAVAAAVVGGRVVARRRSNDDEGEGSGGGAGGGARSDAPRDDALVRWWTWWTRTTGAGATRRPRLYLVGVGPGDPELVTLAAVSAMRAADVLVVDVLVPEDVVERHARRDATVVRVAKRKGEAHAAQVELERLALDALRGGRTVARVKGGDPFVYGRGGEEVEHFTALGFEVKVVPGVSSAFCAALAGGVPMTTRGVADQIAIASAHGKRDETPKIPEPFVEGRTTAFLMSVSRARDLAERLARAGYPAALPVLVVERATLPEQRRFTCALAELADLVEREGVQSPSVILVGGTAAVAWPSRWESGGVVFEARSVSASLTE